MRQAPSELRSIDSSDVFSIGSLSVGARVFAGQTASHLHDFLVTTQTLMHTTAVRQEHLDNELVTLIPLQIAPRSGLAVLAVSVLLARQHIIFLAVPAGGALRALESPSAGLARLAWGAMLARHSIIVLAVPAGRAKKKPR